MRTVHRFVGIFFLVCLLVLLRFFEDWLFYDPFNDFFMANYLQGGIPDFRLPELLLSLSFRFWLNSAISLLILYVAFLDKSIPKFAALLYLILFVVGIGTFTVLVLTLENISYMPLFYVRRFLVHPLFILILLPAFYYFRLHKRRSNKSKPGPDKV